MGYNYSNQESEMLGGGKKIVRNVSIKNNKGYKSITKYKRGKKVGTVKKRLTPSEINTIKNKKFIPGLFNTCNNCYRNKFG